MIWLFRSSKDGYTQPVQFAVPPAHLAPCLFPPIPVKSTSSWSFTRSLLLPSCFYSWQSPLLEFIQHVFFFFFFKVSMYLLSIICQALFQAAGMLQCTQQTKISAFMEQTSLSRCFFLSQLHHLVTDLIPGGPAQIPVQIRGPHMEIAFSKLSLCLSSLQYI